MKFRSENKRRSTRSKLLPALVFVIAPSFTVFAFNHRALVPHEIPLLYTVFPPLPLHLLPVSVHRSSTGHNPSYQIHCSLFIPFPIHSLSLIFWLMRHQSCPQKQSCNKPYLLFKDSAGCQQLAGAIKPLCWILVMYLYSVCILNTLS